MELQSWYPDVAYGASSLQDGRWWTFLTGAFFSSPAEYPLVIAGVILLVGWAEHYLGTRRAAAVCLLGQVGVTLWCAVLLLALRDHGWAWASALSSSLDLGFSAGAVAAGAAASAAMQPPWRLRLRVALVAFALIGLLYGGSLGDLEHSWAVLAGLVAGPFLVRPALNAPVRVSRREWRLLATAGLLLVASTFVMVRMAPGQGPLGSTKGLAESVPVLLIALLIIGVLANGLRKGSRSAWYWTVAISAFFVSFGFLVAVAASAAAITGTHIELNGLPVVVPQAVFWAVELVLLLAGREAFDVHGWPRRMAATGTLDRNRAKRILIHDGGSNLSWMTTWPDNRYIGAPRSGAYMAYQVRAGVAIALGDPVGRQDERGAALQAFSEMCEESGLVPCVFSASAATLPRARQLGWREVQVAEDTLINLDRLEFRGKAWQDVRTALNRARKENIEFRLTTLADEPAQVQAQARALCEEWADGQRLPEMRFTLGSFDEALDPRVRVGLAFDRDGELLGLTSWLPVYAGKEEVEGWVLDAMRRRHDGFKPVMEFLIASSCLAFQERGVRFVSLSGAPLARVQGATRAPLDRFLQQLGSALEPYYGFRSLHAFKAKFSPSYEPMFLIYRDEADLPRIGAALTQAFLSAGGVRKTLRCLVGRTVKSDRIHGDCQTSGVTAVVEGY
ncbi:bifunctional lysylphosphatidylglycerol flippase/synthetase MprF [Streptomyces sp. NPDC127178]|uniref:bifunctional lysylphosphatidylglycerol flippase/synthetase MprF n=1 Tax=unclassified Streptomyces TaxID=2593676 RepID=UPI003640CCCE